jgi:DNA-binding response OmpR family regulator
METAMRRTPLRVLVVDDDKEFYGLLARLLESQGYEVERASHVLAAFKLSQRRHYELFIIDARIPMILGTRLAEWLKEQIAASRIILISAFVDESLRRCAEQLAVPLLIKPFTNESLLALVRQSIEAISYN